MESIVPVVHSLMNVIRAEICQTGGCFGFYDIYFNKECKIKAVQMARLLFTQVCGAQTCISSARSHFVANVRKKSIES